MDTDKLIIISLAVTAKDATRTTKPVHSNARVDIRKESKVMGAACSPSCLWYMKPLIWSIWRAPNMASHAGHQRTRRSPKQGQSTTTGSHPDHQRPSTYHRWPWLREDNSVGSSAFRRHCADRVA